MRWLNGVWVLGLVCAVSGCATFALSEGGYTHYHRTETVVVEDQVIGIGEVRAPKWGLPDEIPLVPDRTLEHVPTLVLVGDKHSYVVNKGGYEIAQIAQNLDGNRVRLDVGSRDALVLYSLMGQDERGHDVRLFEGGLVVFYDKSDVELSDAERGFLKRLNFDQSATGFRKRLVLAGAVYPAVVNAAGLDTTFKQSRAIRLVEQGGFSTPKLWKFAALPVGVAFDVVTAPIWLAYWLMNPLKIGF